jgi:hypothetical protein
VILLTQTLTAKTGVRVADGKIIFDFSHAQRAALHWCTQEQHLAAGDGTATDGPYTVARA